MDWRNRSVFLNDNELLEAAEAAVLELEELPLDNAYDTEQEETDDEEDDVAINPNINLEEEISTENVNLGDERRENTNVNERADNKKTKGKNRIERKWKKREVRTAIPEYDLLE